MVSQITKPSIKDIKKLNCFHVVEPQNNQIYSKRTAERNAYGIICQENLKMVVRNKNSVSMHN